MGSSESGGTRTNPVEAKIVARAIVAHACEYPELSLGVAAFSAAQRRAIQDQLEILRRQLTPEDEAFFQSHPSEPFFIKNLENVQGDERDVIFYFGRLRPEHTWSEANDAVRTARLGGWRAPSERADQSRQAAMRGVRVDDRRRHPT